MFRDDGEGVVAAHPRFQPSEVLAEDGTQDDVERQCAHLGGDIEGFARMDCRVPTNLGVIQSSVDDGGVLLHHLAMEGRLNHAALALPEVALAHHDAVAEQDFYPVQPDTLGVIAVIGDQQTLDIVRMVADPSVTLAARRIDPIEVAQFPRAGDEQFQAVLGRGHIELCSRQRRQAGTGRFQASRRRFFRQVYRLVGVGVGHRSILPEGGGLRGYVAAETGRALGTVLGAMAHLRV